MTTALLHLAIALVWLFLSPDRDLVRFVTGLGVGYALLLVFRPLLPKDRYLKGSRGFLLWALAFNKALVISQFRVAQLILFPRRYPVHPGFVSFDLGDLKPLEILILSHSITLTPGTTSVDVDLERRTLLIHALEAGDPDAVIADIRETLLKPLLAFTRP